MLVVDDDRSLRAVARVTLAAQGFEVLEAEDPDGGLSTARNERPDVILLDVLFPGETRDGFALCRELRSLPATRHVPIVLFTAHDDPENRAFASAVGATAYLVKPFGPLDLLRIVRLVQGPSGDRPGLGLYLIDAGVILPDQLERALAEQRLRQGPRVPLGQLVVELGFATPEEVRHALTRQQKAREDPQTPRVAVDLRVVVADDHASVRDALRAAIAAEDGLSVVGVARDGEEALQKIRALRPDVVVLDNDMPRRGGLDVLRAMRSELPQVAVVMFTLDDSKREEALAAGAAAVVTKDSPLRVLVAEVRRAASARLPEAAASVGVVLAARSVARTAWGVFRRRQRAIGVLGVMGVTHAGAFLLFEPYLGASASLVGLAPAAIAGALLGPEAGLVGALLASALTLVLWEATGHPMGEPILTVGGNGIGVLALMGIGAGFGAMRALRGRIAPAARRASALAEAATVLASGGGPETLGLLTAGVLDVVPGNGALLFLAIPGGGLELVAVSGVPERLVGTRQTGDAVGRAHAQRRGAIVDAGAASIGVELPRMRTAAVVPVRGPGEGPSGVLVAVSLRGDTYRRAHLDALRVYADFVGMSIAARLHETRPHEREIAARGPATG